MKITSLEFYEDHIFQIGLICIAISLITWGTDLAALVSPCPYCRVGRTVIGVLGILMMFQNIHNWMLLYVASVIGFFGANVAAAQNFFGWIRISEGEFQLNDPIYFDSFLLSAAALAIIVGQIWLITLSVKNKSNA